jgi:hypothetical protein
MSASATLKQTIYSEYTKYTCIMDKKESEILSPVIIQLFEPVPLIRITSCHNPANDTIICLIDTAVTDRKFPPEALQELMVALTNTNLELVPCPEDTWSEISSRISSKY